MQNRNIDKTVLRLPILILLAMGFVLGAATASGHDAGNPHEGFGNQAYFDFDDLESCITTYLLDTTTIHIARSTWSGRMLNVDISVCDLYNDIDVQEYFNADDPSPGYEQPTLRTETIFRDCGGYNITLEAGNRFQSRPRLNRAVINQTTVNNINSYRQQNGVPPITLNDYLEKVASHEYGHAVGMAHISQRCTSIMYSEWPPTPDLDATECNPFIKEPTSFDKSQVDGFVYPFPQGNYCPPF